MDNVEGLRRGTTPLSRRYIRADLSLFTPAEKERFAPLIGTGRGSGSFVPEDAAWEILYRLEPELYDRWARAERLHPGIRGWLPRHVRRILEVAAGSGRLTVDLVPRCDELTAVEPADALRALLAERLRGGPARVEVRPGFFDQIPVADGWADLVLSCSALTPDRSHGGQEGLAELERAAAPGGRVVLVWPNHVDWLKAHCYTYVSFPGEHSMEFRSFDEAVELTAVFSPNNVDKVRRLGSRHVPYSLLGVNPPCDVAYKDVPE